MSSSLNNNTVIFTGDGFVNVSSVNVFPPVWGIAASMANSIFYLCLFIIYFICFTLLLSLIRKRIKQFSSTTTSRKGSDNGVMKRNHIIMFILAGLMVIIQSITLLIRIVNDILFMRARLIVESGERVTYSHYMAIWVTAGITSFFMFLNYIMLFVILFFVQMVFWRTAATMRAISKNTFKRVRIFTQITIILFVIATFIVLTLASIFIPLVKFNLFNKNETTILNFVLFGIILILYSKDTIAILISGILVIKTIRKSIQNIKNVTSHQKKMENPFIVTFSLLIGLIGCILLQLVAVIIGAALVSDKEELKFIWHFINCAGILIFAILTLALFYPLFIQTETVFKELHLDDTKSNISDRLPTSTLNRNSMIVPSTRITDIQEQENVTKENELMIQITSPSDSTLKETPNHNSDTTPISSSNGSNNSGGDNMSNEEHISNVNIELNQTTVESSDFV